jgi:hypothetical protein
VSGGAALTDLDVADEPAAWSALGFAVGPEGMIDLGGVRIRPCGAGAGRGIVAAGFAGANSGAGFDGLPARAPLARPSAAAPVAAHPNGAVAIDHLVVTTPALGRTVAALAAAGLDLRGTRDVPGERPLRQAFLLAGPCLVEVVGPPGEHASGHAEFWGLTVVVGDLDALATRLGARLGRPRDAVQPGRRIATVRRGAGLSEPLAFMTPRVLDSGASCASSS